MAGLRVFLVSRISDVSILLIILFFFLGCSSPHIREKGVIDGDNINSFDTRTNNIILIESNRCEKSELSTQFDLAVDFKRFTDTTKNREICDLKVFIKEKLSGEILDSLFFHPVFLCSSTFLSCDSMTSYSTQIKVNRKVVDNYYGDIVVADFNFDGNDDIAVVNDGGGNGGPLYCFYLHEDDGKFTKDIFLTDSVSFFPSKINPKDKTLTTHINGGVCSLGEHIYKLEKNNWVKKSHRVINICEE